MTHDRSADDLTHLRQQMSALADFAHNATMLSLADVRHEAAALLYECLPVERTAVWQALPDTNELLLAAGNGWQRAQIGHFSLRMDPNHGETHALKSDSAVPVTPEATPLTPTHELAEDGLAYALHVGIANMVVLSSYTHAPLSEDERQVMRVVAGTLRTAIALHDAQAAAEKNANRLDDRTRQVELLSEELRTYTYLVTHDIRDSQRIIQGFADILNEEYAPLLDEEGAYLVERIRSASVEIDDFLEGMIELDRIIKADMHRSTVDLSTVVEEIRADLEAHHPDRDVTWLIDQQLMVNGDRYLLRMALMHLITNAWTFTQDKPHAQIGFGLTRRNDKQVFYVQDNGIGFEMHDRNRDVLFVPFRTVHQDDRYIGRGLGLASVRRIIHRHGGHVWMEAEPGNGATVYFSIPGIRIVQ